MIIEYSNAKEPKNHARLSVVIVVASCAFFFIPTTLIILGYLASQPTGSLISPLPQGVLSQITPTPLQQPITTPEPVPTAPIAEAITQPIIAAPNESTISGHANISQVAGSNIIDKTASVSAGLTEMIVPDADIKLASQVYLSPRPGDSAIYTIKSKTEGQMIITINPASDTLRYIDYHIVSP